MEDRVYVCVITGRNRETMFMQEIQVVYAMQRPYMQQREREREREFQLYSSLNPLTFKTQKLGWSRKVQKIASKNCVKQEAEDDRTQ